MTLADLPQLTPSRITKCSFGASRRSQADSLFGCAEIWDALRAAAEAEISLAQLIVDSAGIIVQSEDLSTCYDERGHLRPF